MRLLGPAATFVQAVITKAATAVIPPKKKRRVPGERWIDEDGRAMTYWPDERDEPDRLDYFAPGGVRRALDRMNGHRPRW